jgi:TonB-linked SusC/RagA family outer membrane protein
MTLTIFHLLVAVNQKIRPAFTVKWLLFGLSLCWLPAVANKGTGNPFVVQAISGTITNEAGNAIDNASIVEKGTQNGTVSDGKGHFELNVVDANAILIISAVGFEAQEIKIGTQTSLQVKLKAGDKGLDSVVVVGYGTQRRKNISGSITTVNASYLENRPITNASQALQGITGLYINQPGGQPGNDGASIRLRGVGTLNNNDPLVLLNGIEYDLKDINPNDIATISVLKDAAAASIYGSRAANGVILITTKDGKKGKTQLDYNYYYGLQQATYLPDVVDNSVDYMQARNTASVNEGQPIVFTDAFINAYKTGGNPDLYPNTNWFDIMFKTAPIQEHNVRLSGGTDKTTYALSLGYLDQEGVLLGTNARKYSLNANYTFNITKKLRAGFNVAGTYWIKHEPAEGAATLVGNITRALPIHGNLLQNGQYSDQRIVVPGHNVFRHPYAKALEGGLDTKSLRAFANAWAEYTFPLDIVYKVNVAVNKYDELTSKFVPQVNLYYPTRPDSASSILRYDDPVARSARRADVNNLNTSFFQTLTWTKTFAGVHRANLLLGNSLESFDNSGFNAYIEGFLGNELTELNAGTINKNVGGTSSKSRLMSYFGRAGYSYDDRYIVEFNFRYDGSSRFAKNNRWGFFPSVSGAWRVSEEAFFKGVEVVSDLKIRGSWGKLGNQNVPLYSYLNGVNLSQGYNFNNTSVAGAAVTALADPGISWETTTIANLGVDLSLWQGKLNIVAEVFNKKTTDILARINVPAQVGNLSGPVTNLYTLSNKGVELSANHANTIGQVRYSVGAGIAFVKNNVDFLNGDVQYSGDGSLYIIKEGNPVNSYYLYEAQGLFQTADEVAKHAFEGSSAAPGDIKYKDNKADKVIDSDDRIITGKTIPDFTYNFNFSVGYKGFNLSALFQGVQGIDMYPINNLAFPLFNGAGLTKDQLNNSWTPANPNSQYPRLGEPKRGSGLNYKNSTFWLQDGSYLRLKNLALNYTIPENITRPLQIEKIRVFVNAQNLLTFSPYKLSDPERNVMQQDISEYPSVKIISFGANVTF